VFVDTQKVFRSGYQPRGDFNPTNSVMLNSLHFQTFPMDSFGVLTSPGPDYSTGISLQRAVRDATADGSLSVECRSGWLTVSFAGAFDATIATASGRKMSSFKGDGTARLALDGNLYRSGLYILSVKSENGVASRRFLVQ
jgi:hypothetical protein